MKRVWGVNAHIHQRKGATTDDVTHHTAGFKERQREREMERARKKERVSGASMSPPDPRIVIRSVRSSPTHLTRLSEARGLLSPRAPCIHPTQVDLGIGVSVSGVGRPSRRVSAVSSDSVRSRSLSPRGRSLSPRRNNNAPNVSAGGSVRGPGGGGGAGRGGGGGDNDGTANGIHSAKSFVSGTVHSKIFTQFWYSSPTIIIILVLI